MLDGVSVPGLGEVVWGCLLGVCHEVVQAGGVCSFADDGSYCQILWIGVSRGLLITS